MPIRGPHFAPTFEFLVAAWFSLMIYLEILLQEVSRVLLSWCPHMIKEITIMMPL